MDNILIHRIVKDVVSLLGHRVMSNVYSLKSKRLA